MRPKTEPDTGRLSARSRRLWRAYTGAYDFVPHEAQVFEQALRAQDLVDKFAAVVEAEGLLISGQPHIMFGALRDARQTALRYWQSFGFKTADEVQHRPGRPSSEH